MDTPKTAPAVVRAADVAEHEAHYPAPFDAEKLSLGRDLGTAAGTQRLGLWHERLLPGRRSSFTHAHSREEELLYVLTGSCVLRLVHPDGAVAEHAMEAGSVASFPPGTGVAHCVVNRGDAECTFLCVGERNPEDQVFYPDDPAFDAHHKAVRPQRHWDREGAPAVSPQRGK